MHIYIYDMISYKYNETTSSRGHFPTHFARTCKMKKNLQYLLKIFGELDQCVS